MFGQLGWGWGLGGGPDVPHAANNQVGSTPPEGLSSHGGVGNNHNKQLSVSSQEVIQQQQIVIILLFRLTNKILNCI